MKQCNESSEYVKMSLPGCKPHAFWHTTGLTGLLGLRDKL